jgi:hypothetical protein
LSGRWPMGYWINEISERMKYADERAVHYKLQFMREKWEARTNPQLVAIFHREGLLK